jgi:dTDP-glucose 4,6-dehydratase
LEKLREIYKKHNPTDVIHFAAESHVDNSIKDPGIFMETNVL